MEDFLDAAKNRLGESVENVAALAQKAGEVGQEALGVLAEAASADPWAGLQMPEARNHRFFVREMAEFKQQLVPQERAECE